MNCDVCQRCLLALENPAAPTAEAEAHLADCPLCREWQRHLLLIERHVPLLPIPPSGARALFLEQVLKSPSPSAKAPVASPMPTAAPPAGSPGLRRWRWVHAAAAAAAAVLLIATGIYLGNVLFWAFRGGPSPALQAKTFEPVSPLVEHVMECDLRLAEANTTGKRLQALAALADRLHQEGGVLAHAATPEDLAALAKLYAEVVDALVDRAGKLGPSERRTVLAPIVKRLEQAGREAQRWPSRDIAQAAQGGGEKLKALMEAAP